jgi:murein DD-endopeptidase MepM/ murein hydrolase activator NlpD
MLLRINGFPISAGFGSIDEVHKIPHKGVDIAMPLGTELRAIADGIISRVNDEGARSFGKSVRIKLSDGTEVIYGHLSKIEIKEHAQVHAGDVIGLSGSTGASTGPHLHLQLTSGNGQLIDPSPVVNSSWWQQITHGQMPNSWKGPLYPMIDPQAKVEEYIKNALYDRLAHKAQEIIDLLNSNATEITTFGIVICAAGMMLSPLMGSTGGKWMGRMFAVFLLGAIWCVMI